MIIEKIYFVLYGMPLSEVEISSEREDIPIDPSLRDIYLRIFDAVDLNKDGFIEAGDIIYSMTALSPGTTDPEFKVKEKLCRELHTIFS